MTVSRTPSDRAGTPAWATRLIEAIERIYLVLRVNLVWIALSLAGLVVLGVAPASVAASDAFIAARHGAKVRVLATMWPSFREHLVTANVRMLPLMVVQAGSVAMLWIVAGGAVETPMMSAGLGSLAAVSAAWSTASVATIMSTPRVRRQDPFVAWRLALLLPGAMPVRVIGLILGLIVWMVLCSLVWPVAVLLGAAAAIDLATSLLSRKVELLLEEIENNRAAAS
ncbi:DUF624 domain-containing protein [Brachybacterium sp. GCM10030267]|uniref:DUF624 domain-containing protein n=1 Tax=Brachybacterium sp. GCM10030267 TaxID=3273381 RepID=UPI00360C176F